MAMYGEKYANFYKPLTAGLESRRTRAERAEKAKHERIDKALNDAKDAANKAKTDPFAIASQIVPTALAAVGTGVGAAVGGPVGAGIGGGIGGLVGGGAGMALQHGAQGSQQALSAANQRLNAANQSQGAPPAQTNQSYAPGMGNRTAGGSYNTSMTGTADPGPRQSPERKPNQQQSSIGSAFAAAAPALITGAGEAIGNTMNYMGQIPTESELEEIARLERELAYAEEEKRKQRAFDSAMRMMGR